MNAPTKTQIVIKKASWNKYDVFYDKDVLVGTISKHLRYWVFYPQDLDGITYNSMIVITKKMHDLKVQDELGTLEVENVSIMDELLDEDNTNLTHDEKLAKLKRMIYASKNIKSLLKVESEVLKRKLK